MDRQKAISLVLANTKTTKRPNNLIEIYKRIKWLIEDTGSIKNLSKIIGISSNMVRKFLSVEMLSPHVIDLIKQNNFDSVTVAYLIKEFKFHIQDCIADEIVKGNLNVDEVKALIPFIRNQEQKSVKKLLHQFKSTQNIKTYIILLPLDENPQKYGRIKTEIEEIIGKNEILKFDTSNSTLIIGITKRGKDNLKKHAQLRKSNPRKLLEKLTK